MIYEKYKDRGDVHWKYYENNDGYLKWTNWIISLFKNDLDDNCSLLDIGCGDGLWSSLIKRDLKYNVVGIDVSEYGLEIARKKDSKCIFHNVGTSFVASYGIMDFHFDYCLATEVIEHIDNPEDIRKIFDNYVGKYMILTTIDVDHSKHLGSKYHVKEFTESEIRKMFIGHKIERLYNNDLRGEFNASATMVLKISK